MKCEGVFKHSVLINRGWVAWRCDSNYQLESAGKSLWKVEEQSWITCFAIKMSKNWVGCFRRNSIFSRHFKLRVVPRSGDLTVDLTCSSNPSVITCNSAHLNPLPEIGNKVEVHFVWWCSESNQQPPSGSFNYPVHPYQHPTSHRRRENKLNTYHLYLTILWLHLVYSRVRKEIVSIIILIPEIEDMWSSAGNAEYQNDFDFGVSKYLMTCSNRWSDRRSLYLNQVIN